MIHPPRTWPALAGVVAGALLLAACSHLEPLSNAYSPFSRELGQGVGRGPLQNEGVAAVSIHGLVSKPAIYHHRRVRTDGYVKLQFEGNTACPVETPSDWKECVWLDVEGLQDPGFRKGRSGRGHLRRRESGSPRHLWRDNRTHHVAETRKVKNEPQNDKMQQTRHG